MGQIVRRKKKGRPSKADLARRSGESPASSQPDLRRSRRRRNVRYNMLDYDDYLDEEEEDDEDEDERRREKKKLKLVMKLNQGAEDEEEDEDDGDTNNNDEESVRTRVMPRDLHAPEDEKIVKKNQIAGGGNEEMEEDEEELGEDELEEEVNEEAEEHEHEEEGEDQREVSDEKFVKNGYGAMKKNLWRCVWWRKRSECVHLS